MPRRHVWNLASLLIVFSMFLSACGPLPTSTPPPATEEPTAEPTKEPTEEPTPEPTRPPVVDLPMVEGVAAPAVIQRSPAAGAELALDGAIEIAFNQPMDRSSVESAFSIEPRVAGSFEWSDDQTVSFRPAADLPRAGTYQVKLNRMALALNGAPLNDAYRIRFSTVGYLEVAQVFPADDSRDVEPESVITVIFNRPVVPLTTLDEQAGLPQPLSLEPAVAGRGEWLNTSIYLFTPDEPLVGGTTYTARVAAGLIDTTGGLLAEEEVWSFTTRPPSIVWHEPYSDQQLVPITQKIKIAFNQPLDARSVGSAFSMVRADGTRVPGIIGHRQGVVTFEPEEELAFDAPYRVTIAAGLLARGGDVGMPEPYEWSFTTVPLPRILSTKPSDGETHASPHTPFTIFFNAPIDPHTVMPNIRMTPPITPSEVYTYFSPWNNTFTLNFGAQPSSDYQVEIGPNIADPYGNLTGQHLTVRFRTRQLDPTVQLRTAHFIGTYNAYDPARLFVAHRNVSRLELGLYRVSLERFFELENRWDWDDFHPGPADLIRGWKLPAESRQNKMEYTPIDLVEGGGKLEPGIYYLTLGAPEVSKDYGWYGQTRHVLIVSALNLTVKRADQQLLVWATDLASGEPVSGLRLDLRTAAMERVSSVTTGIDGAALVSDLPRRTDSLWLIPGGEEERFTVGSEEWSQGISRWDFGLGRGERAGDYRVHIYTDRPIYRPDQTVYFRGIVKAENDASYAPAGVSQVNLIIRDPNWEEVLNERLPVSEFGAFHGELTLPAGAPLGEYHIEVRLKDTYFGQGFQVAAYRAPQFEVLVTPAKDAIVAGESVQVAVEVKTFFGSPVASAPVEWNVLAESYSFPGIGNYSFSASDDPWGYVRWWWDGPMVHPEPILSGQGMTDRQGRLVIELPADQLKTLAAEDGSQSLTVEATVTGPDNSVVSGRGGLVVHQGDYYIGVAPREYLGRAGDESLIDLIALDWNSTRLPGVDLTVELYQRQYDNVFIESETGGGYWSWEQNDVLVETRAVTTDELGEAVVSLTPPEGGTYRVLASGRDSGERTVRSSAFLWVISSENISWRRENHDRITLITDKLRYSPGETAEILIPSPFEGKQIALVTVERANIKQYEVVEMESNSHVYRLAITADHAPNIFVSAVIIKGQDGSSPLADYRVGYATLEVETSQQELSITLAPSSTQAQPGDTVRYDLLVTDANGEPVPGEFSLDVVDKAVLTLQPRAVNAILQAFYGRRALGVSTATGLSINVNRLVDQQQEEYGDLGRGGGPGDEAEQALAAEAPMATAMPAAMEEGVAKSAALAPPGVEVRQEFADTAFWTPSILTDRSGRATIEVTLPDNLTTWTARAVGLTADTRVGEGTVELVSTIPLLIRPVAPRFLVVDDRVQVAALVNNNTDSELAATVSLGVTGLHFADSQTVDQQITLPPGGEDKVTWWVVAEDVEYADLVFGVVSADGQYADASRPTLATGPDQTIPVYRYTAPEVVGTAGQLTEAGSRTEIIALPPRFDERQGELRLELDPSLAAGMRAGLDYLEHFEYECTEQTVSRFLPNILTLRALRDLGIPDRELEAKLDQQVAIGLERLYLGQNSDGGWGWWARKESNPYLSAYVLFALTKAAEVGYKVRSDVMELGALYLEGGLVAPRDLRSFREANRQAWLLFVLTEYNQLAPPSSGAGKAAVHLDELVKHREKLSHYGRAYLAMALGAGDARVQTLLADLNNAAILSATGAHWEEPSYDWWAMNTDTRSTAIILNALTRLDPRNELIPNVVRWLMVARKGGIWETTQETAWALIALTDWMAYTGELAADYDWAVWLNEEEWASGTATAENVDEPTVVTRALAELLADQGNQLVIGRGEGPGRLYYTAHLRAYLPVEEVEAANRGIIVTRLYLMASCENGVKCSPVSEVNVGDEIRVKLTIIAPNSLYYLVLEDPLPAGAEAIDPTLATTSLLDQGPALRRQSGQEETWWDYWWWNWYSHSELRDEKVVLFADYLAPGTYEYTYTFRATLPGEFRVMPTFASEFYFPEVFGRTEGSLFTISE